MEIIIGKQGNQPFPLTEPSISRRHAILTIDDMTGALKLRDNNSVNGTWILCSDGRFKRLTQEISASPEMTIRLGATTIVKIKDLIRKKNREEETPTVDISNLRFVYEKYNNDKLRIEAESSNIMMLRMASLSLGSILGIVASLLIPKDFAGDETISNIIKLALTIFSMVFAWFIVDRKNKGIIRRKSNNEAYLKQSYCCPKCGFHFGTKVYSNLLAEGRCPNNNCKCKFTGK
ncbi:MAG: FHA domain-containing protein [Muribaculaceae bacterium]|nr:FHA domain-containing protein [Muribaculaceae bacterium]